MAPTLLYDFHGKPLYQEVIQVSPGFFVCLVDAEFNQVTDWTVVDKALTAHWEPNANLRTAEALASMCLLRHPETFIVRYFNLELTVNLRQHLAVHLALPGSPHIIPIGPHDK